MFGRVSGDSQGAFQEGSCDFLEDISSIFLFSFLFVLFTQSFRVVSRCIKGFQGVSGFTGGIREFQEGFGSGFRMVNDAFKEVS